MLTHDLEPAIDLVKSLAGKFQEPKPVAHFLRSQAGKITEIPIEKEDIKTFAEICLENIASIEHAIIKCIYLRRRFELLGQRDGAYNTLSSLLHGREHPTLRSGYTDSQMPGEVFDRSVVEIQRIMPGFNYKDIWKSVSSKDLVISMFRASSVGYDKVQLYRILHEIHGIGANSASADSVLLKFINETFHIENEYVMQLNPHKFDNVPQHILDECDRLVG